MATEMTAAQLKAIRAALAPDALQQIQTLMDQAAAARVMLAALSSATVALENYRRRLTSVHALMGREMDVDISRMRAAIAQAEAASIGEG